MLQSVHYIEHTHLAGGGIARAVIDFCAVFARLGHAITLITGDATDVPAEWMKGGVAGVPKVVAIEAPRRLGQIARLATNSPPRCAAPTCSTSMPLGRRATFRPHRSRGE